MNKKYRLNWVLSNDVCKSGEASDSDHFIIKFRKNSVQIATIGISTSKKFFKGSVLRNWIRSVIRLIFQAIATQIKSFDLVVIARKEYNVNPFEKQKKELISLIKKNNILN